MDNIDKNSICEIYKNDIDLYIKLFCEENKIDDIKSISGSVYKAMLTYVYINVFKGTDKLRLKESKKNNRNIKARDYFYDIDIMSNICDYYIYLCRLYDKEITVVGYTCLTGVNIDTIYEWGSEEGRGASEKYSEILKKLHSGREDSLSDKLVSGKTNPVGVLGVLNHFYNWQGVGAMTARKETILTLDQVRSSAGLLSDNSPQVVADQDTNGRLKLSEN